MPTPNWDKYTIDSKINGTPPKVFTCLFRSYIEVLIAHNNLTISYYAQVNSLRLNPNVASKWASKDPLEVPFILLLMVPLWGEELHQQFENLFHFIFFLHAVTYFNIFKRLIFSSRNFFLSGPSFRTHKLRSSSGGSLLILEMVLKTI